jgi:PAS domain S-box-containing protein
MNDLNFNLSDYIVSPLFLLLLIGGLIGIITFFFLFKFRATPGVKFMLVWQVASALWAFTYAFEFGATDLETKILWSKFSYLGIVYGPVSFMFFSLAFASQSNFLKKKYIIWVYAFATLFVLFPFTNDLHHLHWRSYAINPVTNATDYVYGPLFWIMTLFAYIALFTGIINVFLLYFRLSAHYRSQISLLFIASLLPPVGNLIYIFKLNPIPGFDWTPFTFLFTGTLIAVNMAQFKVFELVPFGRNKLVDILPDAILILDKSMRVADYNPALRAIVDSSKKTILGQRVVDIFPHREQLIEEIARHEDFHAQIYREINGVTRHFDLQSSSLFDYKKQQTGRLIVLKDITRHVEAEERITETNIRLTNEIREKEKLIADLDAFSHTVAHDLKNMLGTIVTASSLIESGINDLSKEDLLEMNNLINMSATKTIHITRELLTLASVREQEIQPQPVDMGSVVQDALLRVKDIITEKSAQMNLPASWPVALGYGAWIEEVWVNYISNALKYGGTPLVIELGSEILPNQKVKFWIKDNGKGLSSDEMDSLFNKFTRLDTLRAEGHGLGLSIVKRIIEKLGGEVGVESKNIPGEGCRFFFILPKA